MNLSILYRGPLSSCNYGCNYCPFAKKKNTRAELAEDARQLARFVAWIQEKKEHMFGVFFTPWGEALIRKHYQEAIQELSFLPNVRKVAIQTNLSCSTKWLNTCNKEKVALWTTYHPTETTRNEFIAKCSELDKLEIPYSVGVVGFKEAIEEMEVLRQELSPTVYLWVNAYKREMNYYNTSDIVKLTQIDPLFDYNLHYYQSMEKTCKTGETVFSVDGNGTMYRCHFIKTPIGSIYEENFEKNLYRRNCTNKTCSCHIGYIHMDELNLYPIYGDGLLERIPAEQFKKV